MSTRVLHFLQWIAIGALACGIVAAANVIRRPLRKSDPVASPPPAVRSASSAPVSSSDTIIALVLERPPFRGTRRRAPTAYEPRRPELPAAPMPVLPRPVLTVTGIAWGADPRAIIEGLPETTGARVVRRGESVGKLRVARITPDRVVVTGPDTTWTLKLRTTWQ
ncbi:MAG TPA: hypothetical protein VFS33_02505 [Gemmatimonadales bacterium]|nr:hypothetical protein [Gemmatimonadales bacterium]